MSLRLAATVHRLLFDALQILGNPGNNEPFEIGCKSKDSDTQDTLYHILKATLAGIDDITVECKAEDYIVCIKRLPVLVSQEVAETTVEVEGDSSM
jgi:hypothetical protein